MSTKIYDAFVWRGMGGVEGLLRKLTLMRSNVFKRSVSEAAATKTAETYDLVEYMDDIRAAMKSGMYFTEKGNNNPSSSATIHFYKGQVYVIFFGLKLKYGRAPFGGLLDFHYQNQTDREDGITDKDWANRRRTWDAIFKKDDRPGHAGLVFEIIDDSDSIRLAYALFDKLHKHRAGDDKTKKCPACIKRRAAHEAEQAKKPEGAGAK